MSTVRNNQGKPAPDAHREAVRKLVEELGESGAADRLDIDRNSLARIVSGFGLRRGTLALLREKFGAAS